MSSVIPALIANNMIQGREPFDMGWGGSGDRYYRGSYPPGRQKGKRNYWPLIIGGAIAGLLIWGIVAFYQYCKEETRLDAVKPVVYTIPMGYVRRIGECTSGKHYYNCWIYMSTGKNWNTDVTQWPDTFLDPSQTLHWEIWTQEYRQTQYICTPTKCLEQHRFVKGDDEYSEEFAKGNSNNG